MPGTPLIHPRRVENSSDGIEFRLKMPRRRRGFKDARLINRDGTTTRVVVTSRSDSDVFVKRIP